MAILYTEFSGERDFKVKKADIDKEIRTYIEENSGEYDEILSEDGRWEVFYNLSRMRTSILNWYTFKRDAQLLEIGGGLGALTGLFCDRCSHVTTVERSLTRASIICERYNDKNNLEIYAGDIDNVKLGRKYDYIVGIGLLESQELHSKQIEPYAKFLKRALRFLKPDGKLLLAVENRYGIRYFCGARDSKTGVPFDGLNQYDGEDNKYSFSKQEVSDILEKAGLKKTKFYYPLPDYKLTQLIYSQDYLPKGSIRDKVIPYYTDKDTLVSVEADIYDDLIANGVFEFFSNSFLVEGTFEGEFCPVVYAALSTDRGKEHGFATTIHSDKTVRKRALYQEGEKSIRYSYDNIKDIERHGIKIVPHDMENKEIIMPFIEAVPFMDYLSTVIKEDKNRFIELLDELYSSILASSEHIHEEKNALVNEGGPGLAWGPILKYAYIDMVPMNCFYLDGTFAFYDQEFRRKNYPAGYTMFRVLLYTYLFITHAESILPQEEMKRRYGIEDLWNIYLAEEGRFISQNRNHRVYKYFYEWSTIDRNEIRGRLNSGAAAVTVTESATPLAETAEAEYVLTDRMRLVKNVQLELLHEFSRVCKEHQLQYFLFYGSMLGAVRHGGSIPWDDDIDVAMPRQDYDRLIKLSDKEFRAPFFFQIPENDIECFYGGFGKLRHSGTTGIELKNWKHNCNHGIWIDIFPLDNFDGNNRRRNRQLRRVRVCQRLLLAKVYGKDLKAYYDMPAELWKKYYMVSKFFTHKELCRFLDMNIRSGNRYESADLAIISRYLKPNAYQFFDRDYFKNMVDMKYEDMLLPVPEGYDRCLEYLYGSGYMQYPRIELRNPHHTAFWAPDTPYREYEERFWSIFDNLEGKTIVIFGAGAMFDDFYGKHGKKCSPAFLVDNDRRKWGKLKDGFMIKSPDEILKIPRDKLHLIICNIYYRQIEEQLAEMGITQYYINVQEKEWLMSDPPGM